MSDVTDAHRTELELSFDEAIERTVHQLGEHGFGIITWIDLRDKLLERLGAELRSYVIMGAFDPELAQRALDADLDIGLVLPFNIVVYEGASRTVVAASKPELTLRVLKENAELERLARDASERLHAAVRALESG